MLKLISDFFSASTRQFDANASWMEAHAAYEKSQAESERAGAEAIRTATVTNAISSGADVALKVLHGITEHKLALIELREASTRAAIQELMHTQLPGAFREWKELCAFVRRSIPGGAGPSGPKAKPGLVKAA